MREHPTTRCCSRSCDLALAGCLAAWLVALPAAAQPARKPPPHPTPQKRSASTKRPPLQFLPAIPLWTLALNNALSAPPAFEGQHAFFPIEDERIVAYDLAQGKQLWISAAAPVIAPAASPYFVFVVEHDALIALRVTDGKTAWRRPLSDRLAVPPVWDNGWLVLATINGSVLALRSEDGTEIWQHDVGSPAHARPALAADRVYVPTEDGRVVALRVDTGDTIWEHRLGGAAADILALDERLFIGSKDNALYCLKAEDGEEAWHWLTGGDIVGVPVLDERSVYFVSLDNVLRALNPRNGNQRWKRALPLRPTNSPLKAFHSLLVRGLSDRMPAYKAEDGTAAGDLTVGGDVAAAPFAATIPGVFGPVVIVITQDIVKGATVTAFATQVEPAIDKAVPVLPNPITFARPPQTTAPKP